MRLFRTSSMLFLPVALLILWGGILFDDQRSQETQLNLAESSVKYQAQTFAESTRANMERVNELLLDVRSRWLDQRSDFAEQVRQRQAFIADIVMQIAVIDKNGYLVFSNLSRTPEPIYLGDREHFKVHQNQGADRLFISQPILGKVSNRWSLQFSRPIYKGSEFVGVVVASVAPESLTNNEKLSISSRGVTTITKDNGIVLARSEINGQFYGLQLKGFPFDAPNGPISGVYRRNSQSDHVDRIYGFIRIPEFELIIFAGMPYEEAMEPFFHHRAEMLGAGSIMSAFLLSIGLLVIRNQKIGQRAEMSAKESQIMLEASIEATGEGFVIYNEKDQLVFFNDRYRSLYRDTEEALKIGATFEDIIRFGVARGQYASSIGREEEWIAERMETHRKAEGALIQQLTDGTWLKIRERRTPQGYTVGFRIDITEQVEARREAEHALQEVKQAEKTKAQFLSNISHELRTPLNGIVGMVEVLSRSELNPQQKEVLNYLKDSSEKLRSLVLDLLDFSELQSHTLGVEVALFNPYELLGATANKFQNLAANKHLGFKAEAQGYVPYSVMGDMTRISQVLRQLIENALKFTSVGEVEITMFYRAASEETQPQLCFSVRDTGVGISSADQAMIFQPFTQKDGSSTRHQGGTGIGLSLARGIVEKLGGQLELKSVVGIGSTFTFNVNVTLPG